MRTIKFRGVSVKTKQFVYGEFTHYFNNKPQILSYSLGYWEISEIYPKSLCQFVGLDKNDKEVYETDSVITKYNRTYEVGFYDNPEWIHMCTLVPPIPKIIN